MVRKKPITRFALLTTLVVLIFCMFPTVLAGPPPFMQDRPFLDNLASPWFTGDYSMEFDSTEELYFRMGAARSIEEKENDWWPKPPWRYRLYINNEEIELQRYNSKGNKELDHPSVLFWWYALFEPDYFETEGVYLLRFEFWVKNPYQGDGLNHWRIFEDYWGIYGRGVWSFEYYLNFYDTNGPM